jgi:hypothetical protein
VFDGAGVRGVGEAAGGAAVGVGAALDEVDGPVLEAGAVGDGLLGEVGGLAAGVELLAEVTFGGNVVGVAVRVTWHGGAPGWS